MLEELIVREAMRTVATVCTAMMQSPPSAADAGKFAYAFITSGGPDREAFLGAVLASALGSQVAAVLASIPLPDGETRDEFWQRFLLTVDPVIEDI